MKITDFTRRELAFRRQERELRLAGYRFVTDPFGKALYVKPGKPIKTVSLDSGPSEPETA